MGFRTRLIIITSLRIKSDIVIPIAMDKHALDLIHFSKINFIRAYDFDTQHMNYYLLIEVLHEIYRRALNKSFCNTVPGKYNSVKLFISHAKGGESGLAIANALKNFIDNSTMRNFFDVTDIAPGYHFDKEIMAGTHNGVATCVINIPEQIKFADYAYIAPDYDLNGKKIRHTVKGIMHRLAITVFPESTQSYIILSCLQTERPIYQRLFDQLNAASIDKIKFYISMVLPLYSENMVLSSKLWDSWSEEVKMAYTFYANLTGRDAFVYGKCIGMGIRNAAKKRSEFDYSKRGKIDLFS